MSCAIGSLTKRAKSIDPRKEFAGGEFVYVDIGAVDQDRKMVTQPKSIPSLEAPSRARQLLVRGDILVSTVRPNLNAVALIGPELDGAVASTGFCVLRPNTGELDGRFLFHWVKSKTFIDDMIQKATGASYPAVSDRIILESQIPCVGFEEQRRIAAILDQAEELRAKRRAAIALLDQLPQAIFLDMFGDPVTNPMGWPVMPFGKLGKNEDSKRRPIKSADRAIRQGPFPYYGASGIIDSFDDYIFDGRRLLIGEDGANLLARNSPIAFMATGKYWVNNHAHVIAESDKANLVFLEQFLLRIDLKPFVSGSAQPKLTRSSLDGIGVPTPPTELQHQFAVRVEAIRRTNAAHQSALSELDALFASLQSAFLGGSHG